MTGVANWICATEGHLIPSDVAGKFTRCDWCHQSVMRGYFTEGEQRAVAIVRHAGLHRLSALDRHHLGRLAAAMHAGGWTWPEATDVLGGAPWEMLREWAQLMDA